MLLASVWLSGVAPGPKKSTAVPALKRYLYVVTPGIRNYLGYGGHGIHIFDIDQNYRHVRFIPGRGGFRKDGIPSNVKGVDVSLATNALYISTHEALQCIDLTTEKLVWERTYEGGCDRFSISPDGRIIYLPSLEKEHWHVVDAKTGDVIQKIVTNSGSHNTIYGPDGKAVYMAGLKSNLLNVADPATHTVAKQVGPFSAEIRPFTINGAQTRVYVNVNNLLGFEIGDLQTGKMLHRVEVQGFDKGPVKRHGCPSHGIALTPDEREIWICDGANYRLHVFDNTVMPPVQKTTIQTRDMPGWISFSLDGKHAYSATGEIIDVRTRRIIATLEDGQFNSVQSEKIVEIHWNGNRPVRAGDQFGLGQVRK